MSRDLTPIEELRYQNIQFIAGGAGLLFYGWRDTKSPGTGFLLKENTP